MLFWFCLLCFSLWNTRLRGWNSRLRASRPARTVGFGQDVAITPARLALALEHPEPLHRSHVAADARQRHAGIAGELAKRRERLAGLVDIAAETRQQPTVFGARQGRISVEWDSDDCKQRGPPGCSATRPEAAGIGHISPVHAKGLAKIGEVGEARDCDIPSYSPAP